jgi:hypothetical protein
MADNNPKLQAALNMETADLSELAAHAGLESKLPNSAANSTDLAIVSDPGSASGPGSASDLASVSDLASASLSSADVMRVTQRTDIRNSLQDRATPATKTSVDLTNSKSRASALKSVANNDSGIFKNPFYRYDGGLLNKILALIGNILKALERLFLRLLGARDSAPTPNRSQTPQTKKDDGTSATQQQQEERDKRKERREQAELLVKRQ